MKSSPDPNTRLRRVLFLYTMTTLCCISKKACYSKNMNISAFKNVIWKEGDHYVAQSLNVDVSSFGDTKQEAIHNLREALELYFEDSDVTDIQTVFEPEIITV